MNSMHDNFDAFPAVIADIGGTNARFALADEHRRVYAEHTFTCDDFPCLAAAIETFLKTINMCTLPRQATIAVVTAVTGDWIEFTNSHWSFSVQTLKKYGHG